MKFSIPSITVLFIILGFSAFGNAKTEKCPPCSGCAVNGNNFVTLTNVCEREERLRKGYEIIYNHACKCKEDVIEKAPRHIFHTCPDEPPKKCNKACTYIYQPVCGHLNGEYKTFSNACVLDVTNCEKPKESRFINIRNNTCDCYYK